MYLKSVVINGFKSFGKKTELSFNTPVTAIVGPNGSGKSNVVEAIRFVLGEQSMKSMRGKAGSDLIFKGSKLMAKLSRASVTLNFDNRDRIFSFTGSAENNNRKTNLDFDEVSISREVVADGANSYKINGTEVRLKDILELLTSVNIGSSGHHIISQGEADRILNASSKDRREMIEDALGLKIYQYRLRDSEKKLEKTILNIKEVGSLRREIAPHITFLKKQVEKIEKAEEMRKELGVLYAEYLELEEKILKIDGEKLKDEMYILKSKLEEVNEGYVEEDEDEDNNEDQEYVRRDEKYEEELRSIIRIKSELSHKIGRIEGMIESEENKVFVPEEEDVSINVMDRPVPLGDVLELATTAEFFFDRILNERSFDSIYEIVNKLKNNFKNFRERVTNIEKSEAHARERKDVGELEKNRLSKVAELKNAYRQAKEEAEALNKKEDEITASRRANNQRREEARKLKAKESESRVRLRMERNDLENKMSLLVLREEAYKSRNFRFQNECKEASVLVGQYIFEYRKHANASGVPEVLITKEIEDLQESKYKKIERMKIKLEDAGASGGGDVLKEYEEVSERDAFLARELEDLHNSMESLRSLMHELKIKLDTEFKSGVEKINVEFQKFFALMFGGGSAFLSIIVEQKKKKRAKFDENGEEIFDEEEEVVSDLEEKDKVFEHGIDINVSLPHKKVKELNMLSGGERSLTSIALLFAISQVNPPPFLVLDETDAALDEANSRKYGSMIENLSHTSELIVVTHNRETMSRAQMLYGVTVGAEGCSKLLSIKLEEAVKIAK